MWKATSVTPAQYKENSKKRKEYENLNNSPGRIKKCPGYTRRAEREKNTTLVYIYVHLSLVINFRRLSYDDRRKLAR